MSWLIAFPAHEVLILLPPSKGAMFQDLFDFPFWGVVNDVWGRTGEVRAMFGCFMVRGEE
jgi:hypothetical protein